MSLQSTSSSIIVPASVTVPAGATSATYPITTKGVGETVSRSVIARGAYVPFHAVLQLKKAQLATFVVNPSSVAGGSTVQATVTLDGNAGPSGAVVVLSDDSSALSTPSSITVAANAKSATFEVGTVPVSQTATRRIYANRGLTRSATVTIRTPQLQSVSLNPSTVPGGSSSAGRVSFDGRFTASATVALSTNSSVVHVPASVAVAGGQNEASFTVSVGPTSSTYTRLISATHAGVTKTASITVRPAGLTALRIVPSTVVGGSSATGTVVFDGKLASSAFVSLATNSSSVQVAANVVVQGGSSSASFEIKTSKVSATATRQVSASHNGVVRSGSITLTP